jgi:hypothetical protein
MTLTRELDELACRFGKCAELARSDLMRELQRSVYAGFLRREPFVARAGR